MRYATSLLATLLSLLMASTTVSVPACDLSCWLRQTHPDCHAGGSASAKEAGMSKDSMSMPADMDMGPDLSDSSMATDIRINVTPGRSMTMSPQLEMATERFMRAPQAGMGTNAIPDHSRTLSSCTHETCSQISASTSPPRADQGQPDFLHCMPIHVSSPVNLRADSHWIGPGTPPPEILPTEVLATILRI